MVEDPRDWVAKGDEDRVIRSFCSWLIDSGWDVVREEGFVDVVATKGDARIIAEAKGETAGNRRKNVDSLYGQLLRRMSGPDSNTRYAIVVPESSRLAALGVPRHIREALQISVFVVSLNGQVAEEAH